MPSSSNSNVTPSLILLGVIAVAWTVFRGGAGGVLSLQGKPLPALESSGTWLNSEPLSWQALEGKVVWLEFSFLH